MANMKISELIEELQNAYQEKGDAEVVITYNKPCDSGMTELVSLEIYDIIFSDISPIVGIWAGHPYKENDLD